MLGFSRWQIFKTSAAAALAVGTISLLLIYFIPAPPSTVTMATGFQASSFEYVGQRYRDIFARSHVELKLRETTGALDNIELLKNPNSGVQIALVFGGISNGERAPGVLSLGTVSRWTDCHSSKASASPSAPWEAAFDFQRNDFLVGAASIPRRPRCFLSEQQRQSRHSMKAKLMSCGSLDCRTHRLSAHCCGIPRFDS